MTKIYCLKCRTFTDTENEDMEETSNRRKVLTGECSECGKVKCIFTDGNYNFSMHKKKKKSPKEEEEDKIKREKRRLNRRAKKLAMTILDSDDKVLRSVRKTLREA